MTSTYKTDGINSPSTPNSSATTTTTSGSGTIGSSGHKNSIKGTKLARRARSFKDDLFEKISQMRTPTNTLGRSHSPHSPRSKNAKSHHHHHNHHTEDVKPTQNLEVHVRHIRNALKHFRDVVSKKKLEVVPGNGTVVLELIASLYAALQPYTLNENSSTLISATTQVYLTLAKLIKLCDEVLLCEDESQCVSLNEENVKEVVELVENAVQNLVNVANEKIKEKDSSGNSSNTLCRPTIDVAGQRTSLPDIPLTPKERDILEKTCSNPMRTSHSTESILRDSSPPPKPPLPNRINVPPPLPPKKKYQQKQNSINTDSDFNQDLSLLGCGIDHLSSRSRSPDDNSSLLSASAGSLDSAFNHSREEEELKILTMDTSLEDQFLEDDVERMFAQKSQISKKEICCDKGNETNSTATASICGNISKKQQRLSNESGFASMQSIRASMQSVSTKRSSEQSFQSQKSSSIASSTDLSSLRKTASNDLGSSSIATIATAFINDLNMDQNILLSSPPPPSSSLSIATTAAILSTVTGGTITNISNNQLIQSGTTTSTTSFSSSSSSSSFITTSSQKFSSSSNTQHHQSSTAMASVASNNFSINNEVQQHHSVLHKTNSIVKTNSIDSSTASPIITGDDVFSSENTIPPALPIKTRNKSTLYNKERHVSTYDNVEETDHQQNSQISSTFTFKDEGPELRQHFDTTSTSSSLFHLQSKHQSLIEPRRFNSTITSPSPFGLADNNGDKPPPLPIKKKHIIAYMEICSASSRNLGAEQLRHSVHTYNMSSSTSSHGSEHHQFSSPNRNITHSQTMNLSPIRKQVSSQIPTSSPSAEHPPALPPKNKQRISNCKTPTIITTPPPSPKITSSASSLTHEHGISRLANEMSTLNEESTEAIDDEIKQRATDNGNSIVLYSGSHSVCQTPEKIINQCASNDSNNVVVVDPLSTTIITSTTTTTTTTTSSSTPITTSTTNEEDDEGIDVVVLRNKNTFNSDNDNNIKQDLSPSNSIKSDNIPNLLEEIDISDYLVFKKDGEDGPDVKGGYLDALIVHASKVQKNTDAFSEAFITTFRTFILPLELIEKLTRRYAIFCCQVSDQKMKGAKETFSLLVRVVNDLTAQDLTTHLLNLLVDFVYQLVCSGQLAMAKLLRNKMVEKVHLYKEHKSYANNLLEEQRNITINQPTLLDLKSIEIAEQMTLLDAELFQKIEIPEVLLFAKDQCEEKSPNLNKFTEHFNKMSYWARSQILKQDDAKDREKYVIKFIKIMKYLRKMNNYNSYLALLSALDSAPIRRLEWHKTITEGLKEYCALIDSSSSFRIYRQALAETNPPCIPYIGLVLQDLTFVHVGNPDYLKENIINFSKRWQQHNIIVNMKRFKKCSYPFKRNEKIIKFFENFENFFGEEQMWQISENIKPRGGKKTTQQHQ